MDRAAKQAGQPARVQRERLDLEEREVLTAYEKGELVSVASKEEIARLREAARVTPIKDRRLNIRLSASDLRGIQARALEEGIPYQTLIASVLHKYLSGRLTERRIPID